MKARTHDVAAATALLGVFVLLPEPPTLTLATVIIAFVANQIGGIAPDVDQPTAPFWRNLPIGGVFGKVIAKMLGGHRFLSHSIVGLVLFGFLFHLLLTVLQPIMPQVQVYYVWWAFMIGMISHLLMDTLTKEGVPWLLPIPVKLGIPPLKSLRITTGKWTETLIALPLLLILFGTICSLEYSKILAFIHQHIVR
jgi:inner membrane protein